MKVVKSSELVWEEKEGYSKRVCFDRIESSGVVVQEVKINKATAIIYTLLSNITTTPKIFTGFKTIDSLD